MDRLLRRLVTLVVALVVAVAAAIIFLPLAALVDPTTREIGATLSGFAVLALLNTLFDAGPAPALDGVALAFQTAILSICAVPIIITALIGELAKVRSWIWYAIATGSLAAALPFVMRLSLATQTSPSPLRQSAEMRFSLLFFLTGVLAGLIYWSIAGRAAGSDRDDNGLADKGLPSKDLGQTQRGDLP
jgi:CDP-diglyceride synthetase